MSINNFLLAKFGKKEHLESIKNGNLYFNPIEKYRTDGTDFRGDKNEGIMPIDPSKISIRDKNGNDWFEDLGIPRPISFTQSIHNDENTFIFCASIISKNILVKPDDSTEMYVLSEKYKESIKNFGDYVLIFNSIEICNRLSKLLKTFEPQFGYKSGPIIYRDLTDFSDAGNYTKAYNITGSAYDRYFVKNQSYKIQNEWRLLIDGSKKRLDPNCGEGFLINIGKLDWAHLFETPKFLNTLKYSDDV